MGLTGRQTAGWLSVSGPDASLTFIDSTIQMWLYVVEPSRYTTSKQRQQERQKTANKGPCQLMYIHRITHPITLMSPISHTHTQARHRATAKSFCPPESECAPAH